MQSRQIEINVYIIVTCLFRLNTVQTKDNYITMRSRLIQNELKLQVGSKLKLNKKEIIANDILMKYKWREIDESLESNNFTLSKHYFDYRDEIKKSKVYKIIREMPKGAALHVHSSLMVSAESLVKFTYEKHLYICITDDIIFHFSKGTPLIPCTHKWRLVSDLRRDSVNVREFDENLKKQFTVNGEHNGKMEYDTNHMWAKFIKLNKRISTLIKYRPVREKLFYDILKEAYHDKIMYIEFRSGLSKMYELNGTIHDKTYVAVLYNAVAERFKEQHPEFVGVKMIITRRRSIYEEKLHDTIEHARKVKEILPNFFAGFDLVGQEDLGNPLIDFYPILEEVKHEMNFYFHAGETNWQGTAIDENLFDAILLGSKRIGHGFALIKHPTLLASIKENDIAIEVCVISNLILSFVRDLRNHPLASYLAAGLPVVISSDDPGTWGAVPLSHDYYLTFVAIASKHADLRMLKQLVINSIKYSALDKNNKNIAMNLLFKKWNTFIHNIIKNNI